MGISASLFHNPENRENSLSYRVRPSDEQVEEQRERWNDLAEVIKEDLSTITGRPVSSWLQGSYKFGTQIRPAQMGEEFDIDLGVYVEWPGSAEAGDFQAKQLKDWVQGILADYQSDDGNDATAVDDPKARCNRIRFENDFHIDVPSYHLDRGRDQRDLATETDEWEESDPKAIYVWWKEQYEGSQRDRARRLTRYLKMWAALNIDANARPSSIMLTVLVVNALKEIDTEKVSGDDEFFGAVVDSIHEAAASSATVLNPVNKDEDLNRLSSEDFQGFKSELSNLRGIALRALAASGEYESADIWSEAFKHFFPLPEAEALSKMMDGQAGTVAVVQYNPDVHVVATNGSRRWTGMNSIGVIPKGCDLKFEVVNEATFPAGATVSWMARNEGAEAEAMNDLGHIGGVGLTKEESTAYRGTHNMDVVVKLNGKIIGRRRVPVKVSGLGIPRRNPNRPSWTKLRG